MPAVPDVAGLPAKEAADRLTAAGFTIEQGEEPSDAVAAGKAVGTTPAAGIEAAAGSPVRLVVSSGPATAKVKVPDIVGRSEQDATAALAQAGLVVGACDTVSHVTVAVGNVIATTPRANAEVDRGSQVNLQISTGPAPQVAVPDLSGLTVPASKQVLENLGLAQGRSSRRYSDLMPKGAVLSSMPDLGAMVALKTPIGLVVSDGPESKWGDYIVPVLVTMLGLIVVGTIAWALYANDGFLDKLADKKVARGLITFLIAVSTVGIALILAISTMVSAPGPDDDKRFDRGKQVLTILIGVLGTIVGFYFGAAPDEVAGKPQTQSQSTIVPLAVGTVGQPYSQPVVSTAGLTPPIAWSYSPALAAGLALDDSGKLSGTPTADLPKTSIRIIGTDSSTPQKTVETTIDLEVR